MRLVFIAAFVAAPALATSPTFYRDILSILQERCQGCHRPGEIGPMPLLTFAQVRPWATAIRESVKLRKMPPWFADPRYGQFANDPRLTEEQIARVEEWVKAGSPAGSEAESPRPLSKLQPATADVVLSVPSAIRIPAKAVVDYQYIILPVPFKSSQWVRAVEIRPSNRTVVHHAVLYVREAESKWLREVAPGRFYAPPRADPAAIRRTRDTKADILAIYTPGRACHATSRRNG